MNMKRMLTAGAAVVALCVAPAALAQQTSATINGVLTDELGAPRAGVTVTIRDERTGATDTAITSANGTFFEPGLRVGGPYTITAEGVTEQGVFLQPSSNSIRLADEGETSSDVIVVTGSASSRLDIGTGVGSSFTGQEFLDQPSADRDIIKTLARDPLAQQNGSGSIIIGGANPRFNALAIDGALVQDDFGLSDSTVPTNSGRSPISLDAIESASVVASDYSVKASGFRGGLVNIVTKSGTNEFHGSAFYARRDEDYVGNTAFGEFQEVAAFDEEEFGFSLGGPIIKDKLFFFVNYEEFETSSGRNFSGEDESDDVTQDLFDTLNDIVLDTYGIDMGGRPGVISVPATTERLLAKIDWNINDDHRASFSYQTTEDAGLTSINNLEFASAWYNAPQTLDVYTAQLNSDWSDVLSSEVRVAYKENVRGQICGNPNFGEIDIRLSEADVAGTVLEGFIDDGDNVVDTGDKFLTGSCDRFRHANEFNDERLQLAANASYVYNDHLITFGGEYENYELFNLFVQRANGEFIFTSVDDLLNGNAEVIYNNVPGGNASDAAVSWSLNKWTAFVQDEWQITPNFSVDYGLRYEYFSQDDAPASSSVFENTYGFDSNQNLDGKDILMPRVGFEYTPFENTKITGGFGLFAGGDPAVWISNAFQAPTASVRGDFTGVNPQAIPQALLDEVNATDLAATFVPIDVIDPNFEIPSDWKSSIRVDQRFDADLNRFGMPVDLGDDYLLSVQFLRTDVNEAFLWTNLAFEQAAFLPLGVAPDGRPIYADLDAADEPNATMLTNVGEGSTNTFTIALANAFDNGFSFDVSYAHQDGETVVPGTSSRGISNYRSIITSDPNNPGLGVNNFQTEHTFKIYTAYEREFFEGLETRFALFGNITSGDPISYTFEENDGEGLFGEVGDGEGTTDNNLVYIPTFANGAFNDPLVSFAGNFDQDAFLAYINERGLSSGIQSRGNDQGPWNAQFDFQWSQELPFANLGVDRFSGNKLKFVLDVENVANLLNDEWGTRRSTENRIELVEADILDVNGDVVTGAAARTACASAGDCTYRFNDFDDDSTGRDNDSASLYSIRVGLRYEF